MPTPAHKLPRRAAAFIGLTAAAALSLAYAQARRLKRQPRLTSPHGISEYLELGDNLKRPLRFAVVGDSTAVGLGLTDPNHTLPVLAAELLTDEYFVKLWNFSQSGITTFIAADLFAAKLARVQPDLVLASLGSNDVIKLKGRSISLGIRTMIDAVKSANPECAIVFTGPGAVGNAPGIPHPLRGMAWIYTAGVDLVYRRETAKGGAHYAALWRKLRHIIRGHPELFAADGVHPSLEGYLSWLDELSESLHASLATARSLS